MRDLWLGRYPACDRRSRIANPEVVPVEGAGYFIQEDASIELAQLINAFIAAH
ncbi:MAG: hypothetical protein ACR2PW_07070 [Gammaproteobacteria bacterium]